MQNDEIIKDPKKLLENLDSQELKSLQKKISQ